MWATLKVFLEFVTVCFCFMLWFFWPWGMWDLSSPIRDKTHMPWIRRWNLNQWTILKVSKSAVLRSQQNWENGTEISYLPLPLPKHGCLSYLHPPPEVVHLLWLILTSVHCNHLKFRFYIRVHYWWCVFCDFGQMYTEWHIATIMVSSRVYSLP